MPLSTKISNSFGSADSSYVCPGLTTATLCSTALQATALRSCCEYRTTQLGSFSKHQDDPTPARC